jgi:uncharacterized SAM-binding protein YcdF (DUF218 family)
LSARLVAVLGYSDRKTSGLHPICIERLRHAETLVSAGDVVLLSGWGRGGRAVPEAELMRNAWNGAPASLLTDETARNTRQNAMSVAKTARRVGATEVTVVTSWWHALRARLLVRAALPGVQIRSSSPRGGAPLTLLARELVCLMAVPFQARRLRRTERA